MLGKLLKHRRSSAEKDKETDMPAQVATEAVDTPAPASREEDTSTGQKEASLSEPVQAEGELSERQANGPKTEDTSTGQKEAPLSEPVQAEGELSERQANGPKTEDKKPDVSPGVAAEEADEPQKEKEEGSLFAGLFDDVAEKEETPIDRLIDSLPDISVHELLDEMEEVTTIMRDWQRL